MNPAQRIEAYSRLFDNWYRIDLDGNPLSPTPGDNPNHTYVFHCGVRCVFTYTYLMDTGKLYRHLSLSTPYDIYPPSEVAATVAELFGFTGWDGSPNKFPDDWVVQLEDDSVWLLQEIP